MVIFIFGFDFMLSKYIVVNVGEGFIMFIVIYGDLFFDIILYLGNNNVYIDILFLLIFDSEFILGSSGEVCIYNVIDDILVDVINIVMDEDFIGFEG